MNINIVNTALPASFQQLEINLLLNIFQNDFTIIGADFYLKNYNSYILINTFDSQIYNYTTPPSNIILPKSLNLNQNKLSSLFDQYRKSDLIHLKNNYLNNFQLTGHRLSTYELEYIYNSEKVIYSYSIKKNNYKANIIIIDNSFLKTIPQQLLNTINFDFSSYELKTDTELEYLFYNLLTMNNKKASTIIQSHIIHGEPKAISIGHNILLN